MVVLCAKFCLYCHKQAIAGSILQEGTAEDPVGAPNSPVVCGPGNHHQAIHGSLFFVVLRSENALGPVHGMLSQLAVAYLGG
jgi:hypothetical protein